MRRNERFRGGYSKRVRNKLKDYEPPVSDPDWFKPILCELINDIATIKIMGVNELYEYYILQNNKENKNILGKDFDPLIWNEDEKDREKIKVLKDATTFKATLDFDDPEGARFVVLDAYRRFEDKFVSNLQAKFVAIEPGSNVSGRELIRQSLEEVSGISADRYIQLAIQAQAQEIERVYNDFQQ